MPRQIDYQVNGYEGIYSHLGLLLLLGNHIAFLSLYGVVMIMNVVLQRLYEIVRLLYLRALVDSVGVSLLGA